MVSVSHSSDLPGGDLPGTEPQHPWRVAVVGFEHMHAGDQIAVVTELDSTVLAGVYGDDVDLMTTVCDELAVPSDVRFADLDTLMAGARPDIAVICSTTGEHRRLVEYFASRNVHVLLEKPFAAGIGDAHAMVAAARAGSVQLGINWPLAWYPVHRTAQRLIADGAIGAVTEVHYYDGNRGPLFHTHGKREIDPAAVAATKAATWWYDAAQGGGSLRDYLGYGTTLATWFRDGELPSEISAHVHRAPGDDVDEQAVVVASYPAGLSTFQTRWGTFTDPWTHQPHPRCGFVIVGTGGTIASFDYADAVQLQTDAHPEGVAVPVDTLEPQESGGIANLVHALDTGTSLTGPISWQTSLAGQRMIEAAHTSAQSGKSVLLSEIP